MLLIPNKSSLWSYCNMYSMEEEHLRNIPGNSEWMWSPVCRCSRYSTARGWNQYSVPLLRQTHPLLHQSCFSFHIFLRFLCQSQHRINTMIPSQPVTDNSLKSNLICWWFSWSVPPDIPGVWWVLRTSDPAHSSGLPPVHRQHKHLNAVQLTEWDLIIQTSKLFQDLIDPQQTPATGRYT